LGADQEYNEAVRSELRELPTPPKGSVERRYAGWAILAGVLGIALIMIGVMLVAMLQAPFAQPRVVVTGVVLLATGFALMPIAWLGRTHQGPAKVGRNAMAQLTINLSPENSRKLETIVSRTGKSPDKLLNDALSQFDPASADRIPEDWKSAILQAAGLWKDRNDLPDFEGIRRSADRDLWAR
jgi:predicted transcriptional regulator